MHDEHLVRLGRVAAAQDGAFHIDQAVQLGIDRRTIRHVAGNGGIVELYPKVWRFPGAPITDRQSVWAVVLQVGGGTVGDAAVSSHESSLVVHRVTRIPFEPVVTTGPDGNQRHPGIRVHRMGDLRDDMIEFVDGLPTTTLPRAVVDVASVFRRHRLDDLLDRLTIVERRLTLGSVERALRRSNRRGRRNIGVLQALLDAKDSSGPVPRSIAECDADLLLATSDLPAPLREYPHPGWELGTAFVDRAWPEAMLILEVDSRSWHARERDMAKDRARDRAAGKVGWFTSRVLCRELRDEPAAVLDDLVGVYRTRRTQLGT